MSTFKALSLAAALALVVNAAAVAQTPGLGMAVTEDDIATWDITTFPSGANMPPGGGTAAEGAPIYAEKCALCHGANGEGGIASPVVGGDPLTNGIDTRKTIKNFWASATTLFDFIRRAMPWQAPRTLTDDEVYALSAYLLAVNDIIDEDDVMNADTLPAVAMPNRDGFMPRFPELMP